MLVYCLCLFFAIIVRRTLSADCLRTLVVLVIIDYNILYLVICAVESVCTFTVGKFSDAVVVDVITVLVGGSVVAETVELVPFIVVVTLD